jgi:hypothetical protein
MWSLEDPSQIMINREEDALLPPLKYTPTLINEKQEANIFVPLICEEQF